jgi:hypothetical protein
MPRYRCKGCGKTFEANPPSPIYDQVAGEELTCYDCGAWAVPIIETPERRKPALERTNKDKLTQRTLSTSSSSRRLLPCVLFAAFLISTVAPFGALNSCLLALKKGDTICAYGGCFQLAVNHAQYQESETKKQSFSVGYCKDHVGEAPRFTTHDGATGGRLACFVGIAFLGFYAYRFIRTLRSVGEPSSAEKGGSLKGFTLLTAAGALGLNAFLWVWTRYV